MQEEFWVREFPPLFVCVISIRGESTLKTNAPKRSSAGKELNQIKYKTSCKIILLQDEGMI